MTTVRTLKASAYKEGKWWMVSIPEIDGLTQCKTIEIVPEQAADLASLILGVPADLVVVNVTYMLPEDVKADDESRRQE